MSRSPFPRRNALWYTYLVRCRDGTIYTGVTNNLEKRLAVHNAGKGAAYTRSRRPVTLVFFQRHRTRSKSLKEEARFKRLSRDQKEALLLN